MRYTRVVVIPTLMLALCILLASPAAAQNTYIAIRYWAGQTDASLGGAPYAPAFHNNMFSLSVRRMFASVPWSLSFNLDTGSQSSQSGPYVGMSDNVTFVNVNLHRDFRGQNTNASIFLGYQYARSRFTPIVPPGTLMTTTTNGLRVGADLMWHRGPWSLQAWGAVGISPRGEITAPGWVSSSGNGAYNEYGALLGYALHGWALEAGYRWLNFGAPTGGTFISQDYRVRGFTVGVSRMW